MTQDHVNPEAPWPEISRLAERSAAAGKILVERLAVYPSYALEIDRWVDPALAPAVRRMIDSEGFAREDGWSPGVAEDPPADLQVRAPAIRTDDLAPILDPRRRRRTAEHRGDRQTVRRARRPFRRRRGGGGCGAARCLGQHRDLCRQPEHQLHQYLHLCVPVLRLLKGTFERRAARNALRPRPGGDFAPRAGGLGPGSDRGLPAGRHPSRVHRRDLCFDCPRGEGGGARHACPRLLAA